MKKIPLIPREKYLLGLPKKRMGSGVIVRDKHGNILLLKTSYKDSWEIPGGVVNQGESPKECSHRETLEEIGVDITVGNILTVEYITTDIDDALMFIFDGGVIEENTIQIDNYEIIDYIFTPIENIEKYISHTGLLKRLQHALGDKESGDIYSE